MPNEYNLPCCSLYKVPNACNLPCCSLYKVPNECNLPCCSLYKVPNACNLSCCSLLIKIYSFHPFYNLLSYLSRAATIQIVSFYIYLDTKIFYNNTKTFNINTSKQVCFFHKASFLSGRSAAL